MMNSTEVEWFDNTVARIDSFYDKLNLNHQAHAIPKKLCHEAGSLTEKAIIDFVRSQITVEHDETVLSALDLLWQDHYLDRDTSGGERTYRFRYELMRKGWVINRG